jgi:hypothetical protein
MALTPFRLLSAQPNTDGEEWDITGQFHQDQWYEDAYGQNPVPFQQPRSAPIRALPYPWQPASEHAEASSIVDAIYAANASFTLDVNTDSYPAQITISGVHPVNAPAQGTPPIVPLQAATANTGGHILPGTYVLALTLGIAGPVSHLTTAVVPAGTNTNTITISGIEWPNDGIHHSAALLLIGTSILNMQSQGFAGIGWTGSSPDANGNPTVATATLPALGGGTGQPDATFQEYAVVEASIEHGGVWGDAVTSAPSGSGYQDLYFAGSGGAWTINQWAGYTLSLYYRPGVRQPIINYAVASNTIDTLHVTGMLPGAGFFAGDVVVLRAKSGHITAIAIGDDNFINSYAPSGLDPTKEPGRQIVIIAGTGAGQPAKLILSSTATIFTIAQPWDVTPDSTSVFIVISPTNAYEYTTKTVTNDGSFSAAVPVATTPAITTEAQTLLIQVASAGADGNHFPMRYQPFREVYIPPQVTGASDGPVFTVPNVANVFTPDLSMGLNQKVVLVADSTINAPINAPAGSSVTWTLVIDQDVTGGWNAILDPAYFYNANLLGTAAASTRGQSNWILDQSGHNSLSGTPSTDQPIPA